MLVQAWAFRRCFSSRSRKIPLCTQHPMSAGFVAEHTLLTCFASVPLSYGTRCHSLTFPPGRPLRIEAEERLCQLRDINARHVSRHPQWRGHCYPQFLHARPDRQAWKAVSAILRMGSHEVGDNDSLTACGHVDKILNVVVTGANRGLGFAIADGMLALGHRVVLACRDQREVRWCRGRMKGHLISALHFTATVFSSDTSDWCMRDVCCFCINILVKKKRYFGIQKIAALLPSHLDCFNPCTTAHLRLVAILPSYDECRFPSVRHLCGESEHSLSKWLSTAFALFAKCVPGPRSPLL